MSEQDELVASCAPLVQRYARHYAAQHYRVSVEDLAGEGYVGLVQAAQKFEPGRGTSFATFAASRIRGAIIDALRRDNLLSRPMAEHIARLRAVQDLLRARLGREPETDEIAQELCISSTRTAEILGLHAIHVTSLDEQAGVLSARLADERASPEESAIHAMLSRELLGYLAELSPLDREIILRVFWLHQKQVEIAAGLGISPSRVAQRRSRALKRLRERIFAGGNETASYLRPAVQSQTGA